MPSRILRLWNPSASAWEEVGDSRLTTHLAAADPHPGYLLESLVDAKGDLLGATANDTPARLPVGTNGQVLTADSAQTLGLRWATPSAGGSLATDPLADAKGDLFAASADNAVGRLALGTNGQVLTADSTTALGVRWATPAAGGGVTSVDGQTGAVDLSATYVNAGAAGDTMVGALTMNVGETYAKVIGPSTTWAPGTLSSGFGELGIRFHATSAASLELVRWYRIGSGQQTPTRIALWDTTATGSPVWTQANPPTFADAAVGWKEHHLPAGTRPALVAGREYRVSFSTGISPLAQAPSFTAIPESPLVYDGCCETGSTGSYPAPGTTNYGIDAGVAVAASGGTPAATGAVRLLNGTNGALAWRNAANSADHTLTLDAGDRFAFSSDVLVSEATPTVSLKLTADTQPRSRLSDTALAFGPGGTTAPDTTFSRTGAGGLRVSGGVVGFTVADMGDGGHLAYNSTPSGSAGGGSAIVTGAGIDQYYSSGLWRLRTAPSVSAGAAQTFTDRLTVDPSGTAVHSPAAGTLTIDSDANSYPRLASSTYLVVKGASANGVVPGVDNNQAFGTGTQRWTAVSAVSGTINTSSRAVKEAVTPLDPARAMEAVRTTPAVTFDYLAPEKPGDWYDLPDDPEEAERVLHRRLVDEPLAAAARHQAGFVAEDADGLFLVGEGQTAAAHSVGILLAALQNLDTRLRAVEGA